MFDTIIRHGTIVDGTRRKAFSADIAVTGDRIAQVGNLDSQRGTHEIDAAGLVVAPGFIDVHNHSDGWMLKQPLQESKTRQGFTTEVILLDGIGYAPVNDRTWREWFFYLRALDGLRLDEYTGWSSIEDFMQTIDGRTTQNAVAHVPYANVRSLVCGFGPAAPNARQRDQIADEIRRGMEAGSVGLSSGLDYIVECHADTQELIEACEVVAEYGGLYATHIRYKLGMIPALEEALQIAERSGAALHISHLKPIRGSSADEIFEWIERARSRVRLSFDVYPYMPGSTMLNYLLPYETWDQGPLAALERLNDPDIRTQFRNNLNNYKLDLGSIKIAWLPGKENSFAQGMLLQEYVDHTGQDPEVALLNLMVEERLAVLCVYIEGDDRLIDPFLQHDLYMMGSDGILTEGGAVHPRQFGSAARLLGSCVRDKQLFSLEDAVFKLSGFPAERFGLTERGVITEGHFADLVVFDPQTVADRATYDQPQQLAVGMTHVLVNGQPVIQDGNAQSFTDADRLPGRHVRARMS